MDRYMDTFTRVEQALQAYRTGRPVLLTDDADREDECDLVAAAENITPQIMAMMIRDGSGIVCLCLEKQQIDMLGLAPMVRHNESRNQTAFTVSIEALDDVSTGVSAQDRVTTIEAALSSTPNNRKIVSPGHVFPLCAAPGGVMIRRGHTEGSLELAKMAGLKPAAVLCELMNPDGTMARGHQIRQYALEHHLPIISIEDIVRYHQHFYASARASGDVQLVA